MTSRIEVLDKIMGVGKTTQIIEWMKIHSENKYLFVSPLLTEVEERIPKQAIELEFVSPNSEGYHTKTEHLKALLKDGRNISFTHALYSSMDNECLTLIEKKGYTLILDEEVNFISAMDGYNRSDIKSLMEAGHISVDENKLGQISWHWDIQSGHKYSKLKTLCELGCVYSCKRDNETVTVHLPITLISSCSRVILLTYGFEGGVLERFLTLKGIEISKFTEVQLDERESQIRASIKQNIIMPKIDGRIDISKYSLSWTWWTKDSTSEQRQEVFRKISALTQQVSKVSGRRVKSEDVMYTIPKAVAERRYNKIPRLQFDNSFVSRSIRATNIYQHKWVLVHAYNRRPNTAIKIYLQDYLCSPDDDSYALYEMLQWIWRSRIRTDPPEPIYLFILSARMEKLFTKWLDSL